MLRASRTPFDIIAQARADFPDQRRLFELTLEAEDTLMATESCCRALRETGFALDQLRTSPRRVFFRLVDRPGADWSALSDRLHAERAVEVSSLAAVIEFAASQTPPSVADPR